jgi:protein gp37
MGDRSSIEWTDATWNPVTGCSKVSPGCAHCYAEALALGRLAGKPGYPGLPWTPENAVENVVLRPDRLDQPLRWRRPRMVFVNSMSDLFHELVPYEYIRKVFNVMRSCDGGVTVANGHRRPRHTFQVLTKRPERMRELAVSRRLGFDPAAPPENVWLGTSIENRQFVDRADHLRATPAAVRFISAEPLLGPLVPGEERFNIGYHRGDYGWTEKNILDLDGIDWLIVGGESGPDHRPIRLDWVRDLHRHARDAETAFFFKQWGGRTPKAGGRELDGRTWDEMPAIAGAEPRRPADSVGDESHRSRLSDGARA